jgi:hypothetical protein
MVVWTLLVACDDDRPAGRGGEHTSVAASPPPPGGSGPGPRPDLLVQPDGLLFDLEVPCAEAQTLELQNVGEVDLVVTDVGVTGDGFVVDAGALPLRLEPGESRDVTVVASASAARSVTRSLRVTSNDPRGRVEVPLTSEAAHVEDREALVPWSPPQVDVLLVVDPSVTWSVPTLSLGIESLVEDVQTTDHHLALVTDAGGCAAGTWTSADADVAREVTDLLVVDPRAHTEALLAVADAALGQAGPGQCNDGFLRAGVPLHVIVVDDGPDTSGVAPAAWVARLAAYAPTVVVSGALDLSLTCGAGAAGYAGVVAATGGLAVDLCSVFVQLDELPDAGLPPLVFDLPADADPGSVEVLVNGNPATFAVDGAQVTVTDPPVGEGDEVELRYGVLAECDA